MSEREAALTEPGPAAVFADEAASFEANFDGLVGPTHNYAGLSFGNRASMDHRAARSSPRAAALQGLEKMKRLSELGLVQAVLPPQERPHLPTLRRLGFSGSDETILERAAREAPALLSASASASSMWAANAGTFSPAADCADGRLHLTPANLAANAHRQLEAAAWTRILRKIFRDPERCAVHEPLPAIFADEGAANHTRLTTGFGRPGLELFVYGREGPVASERREASTQADVALRFPARQTRGACEAVARLHGLDPARTLFARQHPEAVAAGVFHNDVIAVGHRQLFLYHELAFATPIEPALRTAWQGAARAAGTEDAELVLWRIDARDMRLEDAVSSYFFNSQLVSPPGRGGAMAIVLPEECRKNPRVQAAVDALIAGDNPVAEALFVDLKQSMQNGGGPACLRLRVELDPAAARTVAPGVRLTEELYARLCAWVDRHYRAELSPADLADPHLLRESRTALDELTGILGLGSVYEFQGEH